jgi:hypothetical protein
MRNAVFTLFVALLCSQATSAQTTAPAPPPYYNVYAYMKVAPGMENDYLKLEKAWKKIHAASKAAGTLESWSLSQVLAPAGASAEYNYVARNGLEGDVQLANFFEGSFAPNWKSLLTKEEIALVDRTDEIRTMVKMEVWSEIDKTMAPDMGKSKIVVVNYFSSPEGKTRADHIKMEQEIWKPVHAARVKDGTMKGWLLYGLELPFGESMPYNMMSVDVYTDMKQYLAPWFDEYFKKVHPGKNVDELMKQTSAVEILTKGELRMVIDRLDWK